MSKYTSCLLGGWSFSFSSALGIPLAGCFGQAWQLRDILDLAVAGLNLVCHEFRAMIIEDELKDQASQIYSGSFRVSVSSS